MKTHISLVLLTPTIQPDIHPPCNLSLSKPVVGAEPGSSQSEGGGLVFEKDRRLCCNIQVLTKRLTKPIVVFKL